MVVVEKSPGESRARASAAPRVAMVGAGQLARMTHRAAIDLGIELSVLAGSPEDAAVRAGARAVMGQCDDPATLRELAAGADVLTFDHEQVPPELLEELDAEGLPLQPGAAAKRLAQVTYEALWQGIGAVRPGARLGARRRAHPRGVGPWPWPTLGL